MIVSDSQVVTSDKRIKINPLKMLHQGFSRSLPILFFIVFSLLSVSTADSNVYLQCSQLNLTSMTPYDSNVNSLFTSLVDLASFYNFNKFETSQQSDAVYGLSQCRGDLSSPNCKDCVANAISQLKTDCAMSTGGVIQLEGCFLKYDNTSFFGAQDEVEVYRRCGPSIGYNSDVLNTIEGLLARLVGENGEYFRGANFGSLLGVAQCVQDLSLNDCQDCLTKASGLLRSECETSSWGDMYLGKCYIRYADQSNENITNANDSNVANNKTNGGNTELNVILKWIGGTIASLFVGGGTAYCTTKFTYKTVKNKISNIFNNTVMKDSGNVTIINKFNQFEENLSKNNEELKKELKEKISKGLMKNKKQVEELKETISNGLMNNNKQLEELEMKFEEEINKAKKNMVILDERDKRLRRSSLRENQPYYEEANTRELDPDACNIM